MSNIGQNGVKSGKRGKNEKKSLSRNRLSYEYEIWTVVLFCDVDNN